MAADAGIPCQPASNKAFQARPRPQQRGAPSESELAFAMGRAMGRLIQCRFDQQQPNAHIRYWHQDDDELDADSWGIALSMLAGYDPYAAAGALAKISMVIGAEASNGTHLERGPDLAKAGSAE